MNGIAFLFVCLLVLVRDARASGDYPMGQTDGPSAFFVPGSVEVGKSFSLAVTADRVNVKERIARWGDGTQTQQSAAFPWPSHLYRTPGVYEISLAETSANGSQVPVCVDYSRIVLDDHPTAYFRFDNPSPESTPAPITSANSHLTNPPVSTLSGLPWGGFSATFGKTPARLPASLAAPADDFSADFWLRAPEFASRQELIASPSAECARLYVAEGALHFELPKGALYSQPLPPSARGDSWHHVAIVYERVPLFPYQNTVRFYFDGVLLSEQHLDRYDTGPVVLTDAVLGVTAEGSNRFKGALAELAFYRRMLPPHRILERVRCFEHPNVLTVVAEAPSVEPFTVEAPNISQDVAVPLDTAPGADNGLALRTAINQAVPGTRLRLVDKDTGKAGQAFYINSLDSGNDWSAIRVFGKHDLELDGGGATLVFGTNCRQFYIKDCQRVAFRKFSIDLDQSKFRVGVYARILDLDPTTGDVRFQFVNGRDMSPDYGVPLEISMWRWRPHDPKTLRIGNGPSFKTGEVFEKRPVRDPADASILVGRLKASPSFAAQLGTYKQGPNFFMINNARFANTSVSLENSEQITFEQVNYYATLGMVFLSGEINHVRVTECKIGLPPGLTAADRPLATGADGYHFHDTQGYVLFENNEIALTDDDPITIKDGVWRDVKAVDASTLALGKGARPGDEFEFYRWDFSPLGYRAHVLENMGGRARMDRPLPVDLPESFTALNTRHHTFQWIIRDSSLHDYYGRLLLCTPHGLVEGNTIQDSYLHIGASNASFDNAGIASAVTVCNNLLVDTNADTGIWGSVSAYPVFQDITFASNSFVGKGLNAGNTRSLLVAANYFESHAERMPLGKPPEVVVCTHSQRPSILDNVELSREPGCFQVRATKCDDLLEGRNRILVSDATFFP